MPLAPNQTYLLSYMTLRKIVGLLGILLPVVVVVGDRVFANSCARDSISAYYFGCTRDVFVGILSVVGLFLIVYRGPQRRDDLASWLAGGCALGVAAFPTSYDACPLQEQVEKLQTVGVFNLDQHVSAILHYSFAGTLFLTLAGMSLLLFTKSKERKPQGRKLARNRVYRVCGALMLLALVGIAVSAAVMSVETKHAFHPTFWGEALALWAFGFSWLTKGEGLLPDKPDQREAKRH